ncbi:Alpha/beta knot methyltransferase [Pelagophyceae sp. CCMP2097]|nr:Alpha/beta knot methyltransferase [Pelagophyceae sp. CCMP2097]|mmetsp:Transcript_20893/g.70739  ORF Transcript_20893/g.70739 Transcript_20893/m.70739 type:complete len:342 (-) Transcript_20893:65-1090(-)
MRCVMLLVFGVKAMRGVAALRHSVRRAKPVVRPPLLLARRRVSGISEEEDEPALLGQAWEFDDHSGIVDALKVEDDAVAVADAFDDSSEDLDRAVSALAPFVSETRRALMDGVVSARTTRCVVAYERPSNPSNVWACLRTIDAFGIQQVHVVVDSDEAALKRAQERGVDAIPNRHKVRSRLMSQAMGAQKWLSIKEHSDAKQLCDELKAQGYVVCATDLAPGAVPLDAVDWASKPHAIVFGNEETGISPLLRECADVRVYMPMKGFAESLNLSVSTGVVLSHLSARQALLPDLSPRARAALLLRWMIVSVRSSLLILKREGIALPETMTKKRNFVAGFRTK